MVLNWHLLPSQPGMNPSVSFAQHMIAMGNHIYDRQGNAEVGFLQSD